MENYNTSIIHFEDGVKIFDNNDDFINFVKKLWFENEKDDIEPVDIILRPLETYQDCLIYLMMYCGNFELQYTDYLHK